MFYDYQGNILSSNSDDFSRNMELFHGFDSEANTRYTVIRVFKKKTDGTYQYPFVRYSYNNGQSKNANELRTAEGWNLIINAGVGTGLIIENGIVATDESPTYHRGILPLTIDSNGDLSYISDTDTAGKGSQYVSQGIVSAVCGFYPIINNYRVYNYPTDIPDATDNGTIRAQRQIIGQYSNGDYAIITGEGRNFADSTGFNLSQAQNLCIKLGLRFAYNLDGGGSTQTIYGKKFVNTIYEGTGRKVWCYIVFNGSDNFYIPNP